MQTGRPSSSPLYGSEVLLRHKDGAVHGPCLRIAYSLSLPGRILSPPLPSPAGPAVVFAFQTHLQGYSLSYSLPSLVPLFDIRSACPLLPFHSLFHPHLISLQLVGSSLTPPPLFPLHCIPVSCNLSPLPHRPFSLIVFLLSSPFSFLFPLAFLSSLRLVCGL